jgi:hypothetical protein
VLFAVVTALVQVTFKAEDILFRMEELISYLNLHFSRKQSYREGCNIIIICIVLVYHEDLATFVSSE